MTTKEAINATLAAVGENGFSGIQYRAPSLAVALETAMGFDQSLSQKVAYELRRQGLIEIQKSNGNITLLPSIAGAQRLLSYRVNAIKIPTMDVWDNLWRIVSFDIPKGKDRERVFLNRRLKDFGFVMINRSIWVHPFDITETIMHVTDYLHITEHIVIMTVLEFDTRTQRILSKRFDYLLR